MFIGQAKTNTRSLSSHYMQSAQRAQPNSMSIAKDPTQLGSFFSAFLLPFFLLARTRVQPTNLGKFFASLPHILRRRPRIYDFG